jgi:hypothetical protein
MKEVAKIIMKPGIPDVTYMSISWGPGLRLSDKIQHF